MKSLQTDDRCKVMAIAHMAFGQVRELKKICPYWFIVAFHFVLWNIQIIIFCTKRKMDSYRFYLFHFCETNLKWIFFPNEQSEAKTKNMCVYGHPTHPIFQPPTLAFLIGNYSTLIFANDPINFYRIRITIFVV